jgi:hypothetical protein
VSCNHHLLYSASLAHHVKKLCVWNKSGIPNPINSVASQWSHLELDAHIAYISKSAGSTRAGSGWDLCCGCRRSACRCSACSPTTKKILHYVHPWWSNMVSWCRCTGGKVLICNPQSAAGTETEPLGVEKCCIASVEQSLGLCGGL